MVKLNLHNDRIMEFYIIFIMIFIITIPVTYEIINQINQHRIAVKNAQKSPIRKAGEDLVAKVALDGDMTFKIITGEKIIIIGEKNNLLMIQNLEGRIGYLNKESELELNL